MPASKRSSRCILIHGQHPMASASMAANKLLTAASATATATVERHRSAQWTVGSCNSRGVARRRLLGVATAMQSVNPQVSADEEPGPAEEAPAEEPVDELKETPKEKPAEEPTEATETAEAAEPTTEPRTDGGDNGDNAE